MKLLLLYLFLPIASREKAHIRYFCVLCPFEISQEDEERCRLGDNFCSQDALQMIRNQLDDDSSDDDESDHTHDFSLDTYIII